MLPFFSFCVDCSSVLEVQLPFVWPSGNTFVFRMTVEDGASVALVLTPEKAEAALEDLSCRNPGLDKDLRSVSGDENDEVVLSDFDIFIFFKFSSASTFYNETK